MLKEIKTLIFLITVTIFLTACGTQNATPPPESISTSITNDTEQQATLPADSTLEVHFIDVGQADAALILCDNKSMLIDGGNVADSNLIIAYLKKQNIQKLDYIICSHAHEDHVGGLSAPLSVMPVGAVYAPVSESDSKAYQTFKQKVHNQGLDIIHLTPDDKLNLGSAEVQFIAPISEDEDNLNNTSIVLKIIHGNISFLFTGDAEYEEEKEIIDAEYDISADVLKVGHHGSDSSTGYVWLRDNAKICGNKLR